MDTETGLVGASLAGLRPDQRRALPEAWRILQQHHGVVLADPVGAGKTWLAMGLARLASRRTGLPVRLLVPARLIPMWTRVCAQLNVTAHIGSHRSASLQRLPVGQPALWVVDEAHVFRNPATAAYRSLAAAVASGLVILVTATPYNNRTADVHALLDLFGEAPGVDASPEAVRAAMRAVTIRRAADAEAQPWHLTRVDISYAVDAHWIEVLQLLAELDWPVFGAKGAAANGILRDVLLSRFVSHPSALLGTVDRMLRYYRRCRGPDGQLLGRAMFRELFGHDGPSQGLLAFAWPSGGGAATDEAARAAIVSALETLQRQIHNGAHTDARMAALQATLVERLGPPRRGPGRSTVPGSTTGCVLFTMYADTARAVARALGEWWTVGLVTGAGARLAGLPIDPRLLLEALDPAAQPQVHCPLLVCTDVLGQGHNLQRADGLVHLDRPWNPVRLRQREGRILRLGQQAPEVWLGTMRPEGMQGALEAYHCRLERTLGVRTEAADGLWLASPGEAVPSMSLELVTAATHVAARALLDALLTRIRRMGRHPQRNEWLWEVTGWRRLFEGRVSAGLRQALATIDATRLPDAPQAALQQVAEGLQPYLPWRKGLAAGGPLH